ncbi:hypothetical protein [Ferrimonas balearica]|uniref:hypothetical protein n=1 Tax=Ferrimonas balearica TaxID=44012 RepID=UPI001C589698|nr:hypothetical protein [Ferrimonas balearica]MBW3163214.1 hypothetical protein [Ferrimonas balearica]
MVLKEKSIPALLALFIVSCGGEDQQLSNQSPYGTLRIPLLPECSKFVERIDSHHIEGIEVIGFDYQVPGNSVSSFIEIEHSGRPSDVLNAVYAQLKRCQPNLKTTYDNVMLLTDDLANYESMSWTTPIYLKVSEGRFVAHHFFNDATND